ncbi:LysB family phage lysis regulatory protein [Pseudomonas veronii]|uniref:Rz-like lysis system protein LysB n=1 Tax=Pseudomonas veronii TaxID=76761 RepID=UPI000F82AE5D|nr:Rz-like lysis system protein LysB [Pseudomonas veronii]RTY69862.1 LysB family phage lysis regulatory protein [Pseudomonas veronii]
MTTLRQVLYGAALLGALALLLWGTHQRSEAEQGRTALIQEKLATANARIERDATTITTLRTTLTDERQAQTSLQQTGQDLRRELDVRKQQIKELKRENAELREWAAAQLPVTARRLRQRPAITGAAAYRDWLSGRNALHPERD